VTLINLISEDTVQIIKAISISDRKGVRKKNIDSTDLIADFGLKEDAHGGKWHRQVSFLAEESIETMREKGLDVVAGNFAENLTTEGIELTSLAVGTHITIGEAELIISQLGKICHTRCAIFHQAGDCVMPREGIFAVVKQGGSISVGDSVTIKDKISSAAAVICSKETEKLYGEEIQELVKKKFSPSFVRCDTITQKEGGNFDAIIKDLTETQKIRDIVVFDPSGGLGLSLAGLPKDGDKVDCYQILESRIFYARDVQSLNEKA